MHGKKMHNLTLNKANNERNAVSIQIFTILSTVAEPLKICIY